MKIKVKCPRSQVYCLLCLLFFAASCDGKKEETPVIPPLTSPLSQTYIGFGVVNVSYTRITDRPEEDSAEGNASGGYLRRGSVVSILQRRLVKNQDKLESWVLVGGTDRGWLRESLVDIYDSELQARTASEAMGR
jgi:hypothetical protein